MDSFKLEFGHCLIVLVQASRTIVPTWILKNAWYHKKTMQCLIMFLKKARGFFFVPELGFSWKSREIDVYVSGAFTCSRTKRAIS